MTLIKAVVKAAQRAGSWRIPSRQSSGFQSLARSLAVGLIPRSELQWNPTLAHRTRQDGAPPPGCLFSINEKLVCYWACMKVTCDLGADGDLLPSTVKGL